MKCGLHEQLKEGAPVVPSVDELVSCIKNVPFTPLSHGIRSDIDIVKAIRTLLTKGATEAKCTRPCETEPEKGLCKKCEEKKDVCEHTKAEKKRNEEAQANADLEDQYDRCYGDFE